MALLRVETYPTGQLGANCYFLIDDGTKAVWIIDPGDDADYLTTLITRQQLLPQAIFATHGHFDHLMAAFALQVTYNIPFYIHPKDTPILGRMAETAWHFCQIHSGPPPQVTGPIPKMIMLAKNVIEVIEVPGHTPGSVAFHCERGKWVIVGDVLFGGGGIGRTDFSYSDPKALNQSVKKLLKLPEDTKIYPGHGIWTTVEAEKQHHQALFD